jgi:hypothetical protein
MEEIKENNIEFNQESRQKKEWIKPDLEILEIETDTLSKSEMAFLIPPGS